MGHMTTGKFRHMPVVEQGKLVGIVSIGDVVSCRSAILCVRSPRVGRQRCTNRSVRS